MATYGNEPVVTVNISYQTAPTPQAGFDTVMFLGEHKVFNERWRQYATPSDLIDDGFESTDPTYKAFVTVTSAVTGAQPKTIIIGRRKYDDVTYTPTVLNSTEYTISIAAPQESFETFTFTSSPAATATEIVDGIIADFTANASAELAAVVSLTNVADELALSAISSSDYAVKDISSNLNPETAVKANIETIEDAIAAMKGEDAEWAYFAIESRVAADVEASYSHAESTTEIFATATNDPNAKLADSTSVLDTGYNAGYNYSMGMFSGDQEDYPDIGELAYLATVQIPGQVALDGVTLSGITVDRDSTLTKSESVIVRNKNASTYERVASFGYLRGGKAFSGQYIDVIDSGRWFKARLEESIVQLRKSYADIRSKIPYNNDGIGLIGTRVTQVVKQGIEGGIFQAEYNNGVGYELTLPNFNDIPDNDKANRVLNNVVVVVQTNGAILEINIDGIVTI